MAWTSVISEGDVVSTPFGIGKVQRVSQHSGSARVDVDGELFEVQMEDMTSTNEPGKEPAAEPATQQQGEPFKTNQEIKKGEPVQDNNGRTGKIIRETQRSADVKWDDNGRVTNFRKKQDIIEQQKVTKPAKAGQKSEEQTKEEQRQEQREQRSDEQKANDTANDLYGLLNLKQKLEQKIGDSVDEELKELRDQVKKNQKLEVNVEGKTNVIQGLRHKQLEQLIKYAMLRLSPLLVGMAGTGKTHAAEQVAEALGLNFYSISVGAQTTKTDIMGYMDAGGNYVRTHFREAYENGGVFLMDEIDAGNANVLITINAALSNGLSAFPDAMIKKHDDFVFIASANTFGNGANRQYVGRNQLDAATLDRFALIEWLIDDELEENLSFGVNGAAWYMAVRAARDYVAEKRIRALVSPRATQKGCKLLDIGQPLDEVIEATMLGSVPEDKKDDVKAVAIKVFEKFASVVQSKLDPAVNPPTAADLVKDDIDLADIPF